MSKQKQSRKAPRKLLPVADSTTVPMVQVRNLMNDKPVMIPAANRGGCCDPSTETYWSM